ncbi:septal ring lytic transglycosylase RlpA family protein [Pedobacter sp. GR22-6]|uniref:septal ring lytic transglycosylase RlpA family protein n=1 Tax=Pedobacter sp. GR22-6 TaxID=3127957 RepID=UPI00307D8D86
MKYCLLLCGMLLSFMGFAQESTGDQGAGTIASNVKKSATPTLLKTSDDDDDASEVISKSVYATYYARRFEGRKTTSGVRYRRAKMTAAHLSLPFGTIVTVTNPENGRSVEVEVNDRGPHSKKYKIDLSEAAAKEIGIYGKGVAKVEISYQPETE